MIPFKGAFRTGAVVGVLHLLLVALTAWYVSAAESVQADVVWVFWALIDFPVSLLGYSLFGLQVFLVHAVIGSLWWFFLVTVVWLL